MKLGMKLEERFKLGRNLTYVERDIFMEYLTERVQVMYREKDWEDQMLRQSW